MTEEPDNETFTKELKTAQEKSEGKGKKADVAAPEVVAVKVEGVQDTIEVFDANMVNGVVMESVTGEKKSLKALRQKQLQERELTADEVKKKEEVVKSMKKNLSGFKARYGDRAKEVMYATATDVAKERA